MCDKLDILDSPEMFRRPSVGVKVLGVGVLVDCLSTAEAEAQAAETEVLVSCTGAGGRRRGEGFSTRGGGGMLC